MGSVNLRHFGNRRKRRLAPVANRRQVHAGNLALGHQARMRHPHRTQTDDAETHSVLPQFTHSRTISCRIRAIPAIHVTGFFPISRG